MVMNMTNMTCHRDFFVYPIICFIFVVQYPYKKEYPMIDWNILVSQIATVAFDIVYFGAIISTIVVIILDNRNPVKTMAWILILLSSQLSVLFLFLLWSESASGTYHRSKSYDRLLKKPMAEYMAQDCSDVPEEYARLIQLSSIPIKLFHLRETVLLSIRKAIPNCNHCFVSSKRRNNTFI